MVATLILVRAAVSVLVAGGVLWLFHRPIRQILQTLVGEQSVALWMRFIHFAAYVLALSRGIELFKIDLLTRQDGDYKWAQVVTPGRWAYELLEAVIHVLQGLALGFLFFFLVTLALVALQRILGARLDRNQNTKTEER